MAEKKTFRNDPDVLRASFVRIFRLRRKRGKKSDQKKKGKGKKKKCEPRADICQVVKIRDLDLKIQNLWFLHFNFFFFFV